MYQGSLCIANALSRSLIHTTSNSNSTFQKKVDAYVNFLIDNLPATDIWPIKTQQDEDPVCQTLKMYCQDKWPDKLSLIGPYKTYQAIAIELCIAYGLLLRGSHLVILPSLQADMLQHSELLQTTTSLLA